MSDKKTIKNGKGDKWRNTNYKKFFSNYDDIKWTKDKKKD